MLVAGQCIFYSPARCSFTLSTCNAQFHTKSLATADYRRPFRNRDVMSLLFFMFRVCCIRTLFWYWTGLPSQT